MCSLCRLPVAKNHNLGQILTFLGLLYRPPFTNGGQIWCARADPRSTLTGQISSECVHCAGIVTFLGAPVPTPFYRWEPNLVCCSRPTVYVYLWNFVLIGVFCRPVAAKNPNFCHFWTSAFSDVASWHKSQKVEHGCTTTNLPPSSCIKILSVLQRLCSQIGHTISDVQKCDGQTNRQKTQHFWPPRQRVKSEPHQAWHGDRGTRAHSCSSKTFGVWRIVTPLGGTNNLGETRPPELKTPITP